MPAVYLYLSALAMVTAGCSDDQFGRITFDSGPRPTPGKRRMTYLSTWATRSYQDRAHRTAVSVALSARSAKAGSWYLNMTVTDKVPDKATNVTAGGSCAAGRTGPAPAGSVRLVPRR